MGLVSLLLGVIPFSVSAGSIERLIYDGIPGIAVSNLTAAPVFPDSPTRTETLTALLEGVSNDGDDFGSFIRGYVEAPLTGSYTFWISSDDASELWLSTDHTLAQKKRIARVTGVTGFRNWAVTPQQRSASIFLQRGRKYYLEVYHKEAGGADFIAVGWQLPDGTLDRPISSLYLAPFPAGSNDPPVILQQPASTMKMEVETATFFVDVTGTQPINYQWFRNGVAIPGAVLSSYTTRPLTMADAGNYSVGITNAFGDAMSAAAVLTVTADTTAPGIQSVMVLPDAQCTLTQLRVTFSEPVDAGTALDAVNYQLNGGALLLASVLPVAGKPDQVIVTPVLPLECDRSYILVVNAVQDTHGNTIPVNTMATFGTLSLACCHPTYTLELSSGLNLIANQLDKGGNTLAEVLPAVPDGTSLIKWEPAAQSFLPATVFTGGLGWADPTVTLAPGEGAFLQLGPFAGTSFPVTLSGTLRVPVLPVPLNPGFQVLSRQTPSAARFVDITGALPSNGSVVYTFRPGSADPLLNLNNYTIHIFRNGLWDGGEPVVAVGAAVFIRQAAPVVITTQPMDPPSAAPGSTIALSVVATGELPLSYQWRLNGVNIPGANGPDLVLFNVQATNSGSYSVGVANAVSAVSSSNALVRVTVPPLLLFDQFENALLVTSSNFVGRGSNVGATPQAGEPNHVGRPPRSSVWVTWMAPITTGIVTFTTAGSSFDTRLAAYTGPALAALTVVASDDDRGGYHTSRIRFNVVPGAPYQIAVDSLFDAQGDVVLSATFEETLDVLPVILNQPASAVANIGDTVTFVADALGGVRQWFFKGVPLPGETGASLTRNNVQFSDVGIYFARVSLGARSVDSDAVTLQINTAGDNAVARDKFADVVSDAGGFSPPGLVATKSTLSRRIRKSNVVRGYTGTQAFSLLGGTKDPEEPNHCGVLGGASVLIAYAPTNSGRARWNTDGSSSDTVLAVYTGPGDSWATLVPVACDNNSGLDHLDSALSFDAMPGTNYWVFVDDVAGIGGQIRWNYRLEVPLLFSAATYTNSVCFCFKVTGSPGLNVILQGSTNVTSWVSLRTNLLSAVSGAFTYSDTNAPAMPHRFYRALYAP